MTTGIEIAGALSGLAAIGGVVLNNYKIRACFLVWMMTNAISACIHASAGPYTLMGRDLVFLALAVHGWRRWSAKGSVEHLDGQG